MPSSGGGRAEERGVLYPTRLPVFDRVPAPAELRDRIAWFWVPRWRVAPGRTSRQQLLPFPASNLVVTSGSPPRMDLFGPTSRISRRDLTGTGWAVGALLRPAGVAALHEEPGRLRDRSEPFPAPELVETIAAEMVTPEEATRPRRAVAAYVAWARERLPVPEEGARLANTMEELISSDPTILRVDQVAARLGISVRGVQRLAGRYLGLTPLVAIRRYRLQEAAQRLREDPTIPIAAVAAELGYADQAHLAAGFRSVLGLAPRDYRRQSGLNPG